MIRITPYWRVGLAFAIALGGSVSDVGAQGFAPAAAVPGAAQPDLSGVLRVRKSPRLSNARDWQQRTPVFIGQASRTPRDWGVFEVVFDANPKWTDELVVTFHLMLQNTDPQEQPPFSLYRLTSRYMDVAQGRNKVVSAVLLPSALQRHGRPIGLAVEFSVNGQVVATESDTTAAFLRDRWWENAQIVDSPQTVKREGYLLERSRTPFALVNIDDHEVSK